MSLLGQEDNGEFQEEAKSVSRKLQSIRYEVMGRYGYDFMEQGPVAAGNSTQNLYAAETMRCNWVLVCI